MIINMVNNSRKIKKLRSIWEIQTNKAKKNFRKIKGFKIYQKEMITS